MHQPAEGGSSGPESRPGAAAPDAVSPYAGGGRRQGDAASPCPSAQPNLIALDDHRCAPLCGKVRRRKGEAGWEGEM